MSIEAAEMTTVARSGRGRRAGGPAGRPAQPAPRVRSSRVPAASCVTTTSTHTNRPISTRMVPRASDWLEMKLPAE